MARRKHHKKHTSHRRRHRKMGAIGGGVTQGLTVIAGAVAGKFVSDMLGKQKFVTDSSYGKYIANGVPLVAGYLLPKFIKSNVGQGLGLGMVAAGGIGLASDFGLVSSTISGIGLAPTAFNPRGAIAGYRGLTTDRAAIMTA
jgi:hypothetical protein